MLDEVENPRAVAGDNNPPADAPMPPTPFEVVVGRIEDLFGEGCNWLDGKPIENQDQADAVGTILRDMQAAAKAADELRAAEKKPHDEAADAVQARYHPLIGDTKKGGKGKAVRVIEGCKALAEKWLAKVEAEKRAKAEALRQEAVERERIAREAMQSSSVDDIAGRERAEHLVRDAQQASKAAGRAEKDRATIQGGGRAITSRKTYDAVLVDGKAALRHAAEVWGDDLRAWLTERAQKDMNTGKLTIPGFDAVERRSAA